MTIAVVAERGDIRVSGTKDAVSDEEDEEEGEDQEGLHDSELGGDLGKSHDSPVTDQGARNGRGTAAWQSKGKAKGKKAGGEWKKRGPRKYINLKLCSLPGRTKSGTTGGEAMLQLLLFESDAVVSKDAEQGEELKSDEEENEGMGEARKGKGDGSGRGGAKSKGKSKGKGKVRSYRGGSGGAFEKWANLGVGSVVVILNARVLRPLRVSAAFWADSPKKVRES